MTDRLPPLNSLKAFEAAARLGSFKSAGVELGVTHGAISQHIRLLEGWLGTVLFKRFNRRIEITEAGRRYQTDITAAFARIVQATNEQRLHSKVAQLRVNATPTLALRWLIPRLSSFQLAHPSVEVRISTSNDSLDKIEAEADVIIRRGPDNVPGFLTAWTHADARIPVCSPRLLAENPLHNPPDLNRHVLLHPATRPLLWEAWLAVAGVPKLRPRGTLTFEHSFQAVQGAIDGLGVAIGSLPLIADDLACNRLVMPFEEPKLAAEPYHAYVPLHRSGFSIKAFRHWLNSIS